MAIVIDTDATRSLERRKQPPLPRNAMASGIPDNDNLDPVDLDRAPEAAQRRQTPRRRRNRPLLPWHMGRRVDIYV